MFLFTTPRAAEPQSSGPSIGPLAGTLREAAQQTGTSFDYLVKTAERESRFDPAARAQTSSATGLFQFLEQTWLGLVKSDGARFGLQTEANAIEAKGGRFTVPDADLRSRILALREDPATSAKLAGALAQKNGSQLAGVLGRGPSEGELYLAHFLGATGARDMIRLAETDPSASAAAAFPDAAEANRSVFYDRSGRARPAGEVYGALVAGYNQERGTTAPPATSSTPTDNRDWQAYRAREDTARPVLGLFRSTGDGAVSARITQTWTGLARRHDAQSEAPARVAFFPRATGVVSGEAPAVPSDDTPLVETGRRVDVPLPPIRTPEPVAAAPRRPRGSQPLDLSTFSRI